MPIDPSSMALTVQTTPTDAKDIAPTAEVADPSAGWLSFRPEETPVSDGGFHGMSGRWRGRMVGAAAALLAVGALLGGLVTSALKGTNASAAGTQSFGGQGGPGGTAGFGAAGGTGTAATGVAGTMSAVTSTSITLKTTGTATRTYLVTNATRIVSGTATVAFDTLKVGEQVTVVAATAGATTTTTSPTAATITVGSAAATGSGTTGTQGQPPTGGTPPGA